MSEVALNSALEKQIWLKKYFAEYVRASGYKPYMGESNDNIIIVKHELQEESGKTINIRSSRAFAVMASPARKFSTATKKTSATTIAPSPSIGVATRYASRNRPHTRPKSIFGAPRKRC